MYRPFTTHYRLALTMLATTGSLMLGGPAPAASLDLANSPLFIGNNSAPNVLLAIDMSGSMDSEVILPTNDGALWWNTDSDSFADDAGSLHFNASGSANGTWKKYVYLFPNGSGNGNRLYVDNDNDHYAIPPLGQFGYTRSPVFNSAYFNPGVVYAPWLDTADQTFADADPSAALSNPRLTGSDRMDLTQPQRRSDANAVFRVQEGIVIPRGTTVFIDGNWVTTSSNTTAGSQGGLGIEYFPATFFLLRDNPLNSCYGYIGSTVPGLGPNGERLLGYEIRPENFATVSVDESDDQTKDPRRSRRDRAPFGDCSETQAGYEGMIRNFANWYSYARKRNLAVRDGIVRSFDQERNARVGANTIDDLNGGGGVSMRDFGAAADRNAFNQNVYDYRVGGGTPNRQAVRRLGELFRTDNNIIQNQCQQNFGILFTDGYATTWNGAGVGNADSALGAPFADNASETMADIAAHYYLNLEDNLTVPGVTPGEVPTPAGCDAPNPDPRLDCQSELHMTTFGVTLGQQGIIFGTDQAATSNPYDNPPDWNSLSFGQRGPSQIDDLWHATLNSRGQLLNATSPDQIVSQFRAVLADIQSRQGAASSVSINSGVVSSTSRVFQAKFRPPDWSGSLLSRPISDGSGNASCPAGAPAGSLCDAVWDAGCELTGGECAEPGLADTVGIAPGDRQIITLDPTSGDGAPFVSGGAVGDLSDAEVAYLRGDRSNEGLAGSNFRERGSLLGDIVHSGPAFEATPPWIGYPRNWVDKLYPAASNPETNYFTFRNSFANRKPMLYVGANDGMLHGIDAGNGREVFAYVPQAVKPKLRALTRQDYTHEFYVDGSPTTVDAFFNGAWHTVLASGLRAGGQAVFALDVTGDADPTAGLFFRESRASDIVLWEFDDSDDADMGYSFSRPQIARSHNSSGAPSGAGDGRWVVMFGNGLDNTEADGNVSSTGNAVLFVLDAQSGVVLAKIDTGVGRADDPTGANRPNGLGSVAPVDIDGDLIVDYVYAGDLFGNLWQFDLTSSSAANWRVGTFDGGGNPAPLFVARDNAGNAQAITSAPVVAAHPFGLEFGVVVYFGTGKYFEDDDRLPNTSVTHSFYGVADTNVNSFAPVPGYTPSNPSGITRADLQRQQITQESGANGRLFRVISDNPPGEADLLWEPDNSGSSQGSDNQSSVQGFYLDLAIGGNPGGEMLASSPVLRRDLIVFSSLIPNSSTCSLGTDGFLYAINRRTGGRFFEPVFDLNDDNQFTQADGFDSNGDGEADSSYSAVALEGGGGTTPGFAIANGLTHYYVNSSNATVETDILNIGGPPEGRRTWRELRR